MFRTAFISMFLSSTALATTWTVDDNGKADFDNIQAAVDAASDGDEIIVMPGTYTGSGDEVVDMLNKSRGEFAYTLIDIEEKISNSVIENIKLVEGILKVRALLP